MKNTKKMIPMFDEALKQAGRDLAKEMGYKTQTGSDLPNDPANNQGRLSEIGFIKSKTQQGKKINKDELKCNG